MKTPKCIMSRGEIARIRGMLEYRRPHGSQTEAEFIARYLDTIPGMYSDCYGNRILPCPDSKAMISCHTDSVHRTDGKQRVSVSRNGIVSLATNELVSNCLGADDAAGMYAAIRMIEAGVKATFIFHREEEIGGRGSAWFARQYAEWISTFDICLALDRRGTTDVIVTQRWGVCASDEFALGLGAQLGMSHSPADGIFTDSANYTELIPECSNLSIGYQNEHRPNETLDLNYLETVIGRLIAVKWGGLPIVRNPLEDEDYGFDLPGDDFLPDMCVACGSPAEDGVTWNGQHVCQGCWEAVDEQFNGTGLRYN